MDDCSMMVADGFSPSMQQKSLEIFPQVFLFILFIRAYPFATHRI